METKAIPFEFKSGSEPGTFQGYASVFGNTDHDGDIIETDAFKKFEKTNDGMLRVAAYHDLERIIGKAKFNQDERGLYVDAQLDMDDEDARRVYQKMKFGTLDGLSVGFSVLKNGSKWEETTSGLLRRLKRLHLFEFSVVPFGANPKAKTTSVKSVSTIRDFESLLREKGFSRREAVAIASNGFSGLQRDAGSSGSEMLAKLRSHLNSHNY